MRSAAGQRRDLDPIQSRHLSLKPKSSTMTG
jgi:hypothetical protein